MVRISNSLGRRLNLKIWVFERYAGDVSGNYEFLGGTHLVPKFGAVKTEDEIRPFKRVQEITTLITNGLSESWKD